MKMTIDKISMVLLVVNFGFSLYGLYKFMKGIGDPIYNFGTLMNIIAVFVILLFNRHWFQTSEKTAEAET
jgi:hypothetical protein